MIPWDRIRKTRSCWLWTGRVDRWGYGKLNQQGKTVSAHRAVWKELVGPITPGVFLCHTCDRPNCVKPAHLYEGSQRTNMDDMIRRGRSTKGERHPMVRLSEKQAKEILRRGKAGERQSLIAAEFGISSVQVNRIVTGQRWGHLDRA